MIRFIIFLFVRFLLVSLVVYVVLKIIQGFMQGLRGDDQEPVQRVRRNPSQEQPYQKKQEYGDVQEAKFVELPKSQSETKSEKQD